MNTLEILPNEILFECFRYFTALDLFHSFDHLNQRFSILIRSVSLHLNFENVSNAQMKQFCHELQQNPSMKQKVHSLHLSHERSLQQTTTFLRYFSLGEFPSLKSLVLSVFEVKNAYKIISMLPSIPDLGSFIWTCSEFEEVGMPDNLLLSKFTRLTVPNLDQNLRTAEQSWQMRRLTLSEVKLDQVSKVFQYAPKLIDFTIGNLRSKSNEQVNFNGYSAVCLQRLHIECVEDFSSVESLLQYTPNLRVLTLIATGAKEMIDADRWEQLICSSLKDLEVFQFYLCYRATFFTSSANFVLNLERFRSDFWVRQRHWSVQYQSRPLSVMVYTIPLIPSKYQLDRFDDFTWPKSLNQTMMFDRVTDLSVGYDLTGESDSYYFSNVKILRLEDNLPNYDLDLHILDGQTIDYLKRIVDLSNVIHLHIDYYYSFESPSMMLDLLNGMPNISSMTVATQLLQDLLSDAQVCFAFERMIKSLTLSSGRRSDILWSDSNLIHKLCRTFTNLEQLTCRIGHPRILEILLRRLLNLSKIKIDILVCDSDLNFFALEEKYRQILQNEFHITDDEIHFYSHDMNQLTMRIDRSIE